MTPQSAVDTVTLLPRSTSQAERLISQKTERSRTNQPEDSSWWMRMWWCNNTEWTTHSTDTHTRSFETQCTFRSESFGSQYIKEAGW